MSETTIGVTRYTYRFTWSAEDDQYVATCLELPWLSWLADTQEDALGGLRNLVAEVVRDLTDTAEPVPGPLSSRPYSGKFNLRVGEHLHRRLAMEAAEERRSLNQYVVRRLNDASRDPHWATTTLGTHRPKRWSAQVPPADGQHATEVTPRCVICSGDFVSATAWVPAGAATVRQSGWAWVSVSIRESTTT